MDLIAIADFAAGKYRTAGQSWDNQPQENDQYVILLSTV